MGNIDNKHFDYRIGVPRSVSFFLSVSVFFFFSLSLSLALSPSPSREFSRTFIQHDFTSSASFLDGLKSLCLHPYLQSAKSSTVTGDDEEDLTTDLELGSKSPRKEAFVDSRMLSFL